MLPPDVIVLTPSSASGPLASTLRWLRESGCRVQAADLKALDSVLRRHRKAPLLIYSPAGAETPAEIVARSADAIHGRPVVVAVDDSDFATYYELMALGVVGYYEVGEGPESIGRAVQHFRAVA